MKKLVVKVCDRYFVWALVFAKGRNRIAEKMSESKSFSVSRYLPHLQFEDNCGFALTIRKSCLRHGFPKSNIPVTEDTF